MGVESKNYVGLCLIIHAWTERLSMHKGSDYPASAPGI
jgi:hypothetical protein